MEPLTTGRWLLAVATATGFCASCECSSVDRDPKPRDAADAAGGAGGADAGDDAGQGGTGEWCSEGEGVVPYDTGPNTFFCKYENGEVCRVSQVTTHWTCCPADRGMICQ